MFELIKSIILEQMDTIKLKSFTQTSTYKRGFKKHKHNSKLMKSLKRFMSLLKNSEKIPNEFNDHLLTKGVLKGKRTAHLQGQQIVILYEVHKDMIKLLGLGSHTEIGTQK